MVTALERREFLKLFSNDQRKGIVRIGRERANAAEVPRLFPQRNLSTYVFKATALYAGLRRLGHPPGREVYLTDLVELLSQGGKPARVLAYEVKPAEAIMAFNTTKELAAVRSVFRT